jgi:hypothetical protein
MAPPGGGGSGLTGTVAYNPSPYGLTRPTPGRRMRAVSWAGAWSERPARPVYGHEAAQCPIAGRARSSRAERPAHNRLVGGSNPSGPTKFFAEGTSASRRGPHG